MCGHMAQQDSHISCSKKSIPLKSVPKMGKLANW